MPTQSFSDALSREQKALIDEAAKLKARALQLEKAAAALGRAMSEAGVALGKSAVRLGSSGAGIARGEASRKALEVVHAAKGRVIGTSEVVKTLVQRAGIVFANAGERASFASNITGALARYADQGLIKKLAISGARRERSWQAVEGAGQPAPAGRKRAAKTAGGGKKRGRKPGTAASKSAANGKSADAGAE